MKRRNFLLALAGGAVPLPGAVILQGFDEQSLPKLLGLHKGKVVLFSFWATWCSPCRAEMPLLVEMEKRLGPKGFRLVTVSADDPEDEPEAARFLARNQVPGPAYIKRAKNDDAFINSVDPKWSGALPALFLYDRTGRKARSFIGETDMKALEAAIIRLL